MELGTNGVCGRIAPHNVEQLVKVLEHVRVTHHKMTVWNVYYPMVQEVRMTIRQARVIITVLVSIKKFNVYYVTYSIENSYNFQDIKIEFPRRHIFLFILDKYSK